MVDEEVTAVVLAILMIMGVLAASRLRAFQTIFAGNMVEPFSELCVLGPNKKIADYPHELVTGQPFDLYIYIGNHESHSMYYRVLVKTRDRTTNVSDIKALNSSILASHDSIIQYGGNQTIPITLILDDAGLNQMLVFELHTYNLEKKGFEYHGRWCQLRLNVTRPPT